ncbi:MAG: hypothetical protein OQL27_07625 [Sedimenticola sp.]|nr:hypothetical protein [Sedimenticola sp.]
MSRNHTRDNLHTSRDNEDTIRRSFDGTIDFRYYQLRAHCLRSTRAWDIIRSMGQILPFHRHRDESLHLDKSGCTMM